MLETLRSVGRNERRRHCEQRGGGEGEVGDSPEQGGGSGEQLSVGVEEDSQMRAAADEALPE
eukprot:5273257-Prorocentrum_lima.AAC.1